MQNLANLYIETSQLQDGRKSDALQKKIADLGCIDSEMRIVVQRIESEKGGSQGNGGAGNSKPEVVKKLVGNKNPQLTQTVKELLNHANSDANFGNYDECFKRVCKAISELERA